MKKIPYSVRQGDVLLLDAAYVGGVPTNMQDITPPEGRIVLKHGEATGHAHAFYDNTHNVHLRSGGGGERYLHVAAPMALKHDEHETVTVPKNDYVLPEQVEYTPTVLRLVQD